MARQGRGKRTKATIGGRIASVPVLTADGVDGTSGEGGKTNHRLDVGDVVPLAIADDVMRVVIGIRDGRLEVTLVMRIDASSDAEWNAADRLPVPLGLFVKPPFAWFMVEFLGIHHGAAFPLKRDVDLARAIRAQLRDPAAPRSIVLYGVGGDLVRIIKGCVSADDLWPMPSEGMDVTPFGLETARYVAELETAAFVKAGSRMFAEAMRRLSEGRPRRTSAGRRPAPVVRSGRASRGSMPKARTPRRWNDRPRARRRRSVRRGSDG